MCEQRNCIDITKAPGFEIDSDNIIMLTDTRNLFSYSSQLGCDVNMDFRRPTFIVSLVFLWRNIIVFKHFNIETHYITQKFDAYRITSYSAVSLPVIFTVQYADNMLESNIWTSCYAIWLGLVKWLFSVLMFSG